MWTVWSVCSVQSTSHSHLCSRRDRNQPRRTTSSSTDASQNCPAERNTKDEDDETKTSKDWRRKRKKRSRGQDWRVSFYSPAETSVDLKGCDQGWVRLWWSIKDHEGSPCMWTNLFVQPSSDHHGDIGIPFDGLLSLPKAVHFATGPGALKRTQTRRYGFHEDHDNLLDVTLDISEWTFTP